ncbi:ABC transporter permease [Thermococcus aciditolerans]|uniref:ABC transporter permease n=1 Tax=Thermococcus aciditolerans TaxID=2598455 RepID=A0A5C0SMY9_9EURY|nr:ABC transporter permease [Thermococcus aciditolerans]QEK15116.1 ABC transporter permease [Thermococcus aciditolerans]
MRANRRGVLMIAVFIAFLVGAHCSVSSSDMEHWDDRLYWKDYPKNALPVWHPSADMGVLRLDGQGEFVVSVEALPTNLVLSKATLVITRPDGRSIRLSGNGSVNSNTTLVAGARAFARELGLDETALILYQPTQLLFLSENGTLLKGDYIFRMEVGRAILFGNAYGLLGTDGYGRDLWVGFVKSTWGTIVLTVFTVSFVILIGLPFGVISGYHRNVLGDAVTVIVDAFNSIPAIPLVLVIIYAVSRVGAYTKLVVPDWLTGIIVSMFFFSQYSNSIRGIVENEKVKEYIAASKSIGASDIYVVFRHILPIVLSYTVPYVTMLFPRVMAFISVLGLFNIIPGNNWGSYIAEALKQGALMGRYWWWVMAPVAVIAFLAVAVSNLFEYVETSGVQL